MNFEDIFDESYERIISQGENGRPFFKLFYKQFLDASPEIRNKFKNTNMTHQETMLKKSFYSLLTFYASNNVDDYLKKIAGSHSRRHLNILPHLYDVWLEVLINTVKTYDPQYDESVELAWRLVMTPGIVYMKFYYDRN